MMTGNVCPVCGYPDLNEPPYNQQGAASYEICPCCSTEFGVTDNTSSIAARSAQHSVLRTKWMSAGAKWWHEGRQLPPNNWQKQKPPDWSAEKQLAKAGLALQEIGEAERNRKELLQQMTPWEAEHEQWLNWYMDKLEHHSVRSTRTSSPSYRCPCCAYKTLCSRGHYDRCEVCGWQDDGQDEEDAFTERGGVNGFTSLVQARTNYQQFEASLPERLGHVRPPRPEEMS